ncbi:hypothetical protein HEL23_027410, partial [Escherichia coli]|nr:hypothetical protein [Escherichia coli]
FRSLWMRETKSWSSGLYVSMTKGIREIARCTEREFATILAGISAGGTVHWPDGVTLPF